MGPQFTVRAWPADSAPIRKIQSDGSVLNVPFAVFVQTGGGFGLVPALQASHVDLNSSLKSGARTGSGGENKGRVRNALIMAEVALALVLLISAGLLIQSFARLGRVQPGVRTERLLTARVA